MVILTKETVMPIKSIFIVLFLLVLVWIPVIFNFYDILMATMLTLSFIVAGFIGDKISSRISKDNGE